MDKDEIIDLLSKLKLELASLENNSTQHTEITLLIAEIEDQLLSIESEQQEPSIVLNIRNKIEQLEAEHPRITNILSEIMIKLINIGV